MHADNSRRYERNGIDKRRTEERKREQTTPIRRDRRKRVCKNRNEMAESV